LSWWLLESIVIARPLAQEESLFGPRYLDKRSKAYDERGSVRSHTTPLFYTGGLEPKYIV
jgi:hypothetical protein